MASFKQILCTAALSVAALFSPVLSAQNTPGGVLANALSESEVMEIAAAVYSDFVASKRNVVTALETEKSCWSDVAKKTNNRSARLGASCAVVMMSGATLGHAQAWRNGGMRPLFYQQEANLSRLKAGLKKGGFSDSEIKDFMDSKQYWSYFETVLLTMTSLGG